jgi:hypothetical protein
MSSPHQTPAQSRIGLYISLGTDCKDCDFHGTSLPPGAQALFRSGVLDYTLSRRMILVAKSKGVVNSSSSKLVEWEYA